MTAILDQVLAPAAPIKLVTFATLLDGLTTETAGQAYDTAVAIADHALELASSDVCDVVEPMHDALARFAALGKAGLLKVVS